MHAVVARSTFGSENVKNTRGSDHFLTMRLPFDVEKVHALWGEAHFVSKTADCKRILMCQMSFCCQIDGYRNR